jgi:flagellar hook-associated protein 1
MGNLLNSLATVAESMRASQLAIEVAGNNVTNAKTPNFAKQRLDLQARRFEIDRGLAGGVRSNGLVSSRKEYLEDAVHQQSNRYGQFTQQSADLERIEPIFDIANNSGLGGAVDRLFEAFSAWSVSPNDTPSRENVLAKARDLAQSFRFTTASLASAGADSHSELQGTVDEINRLGGEIQKYNLQVRGDARNLQDPGLESQIYQKLDSLAELVDFDVVRADDGSLTVNIGGQTPLTVGGSLFPVAVDPSGSKTQLVSAQGRVITGQIEHGKLRAQLDQSNSLLPSLKTDLDRLAATIANSVNATLASGLDRNGNTPVTDLFRYDVAQGAAATLTVNDIAPSELAGASTSAPGGNGNALALADLSRSRMIDDYAPGQFYGNLAGKVGRALAGARTDENTQALLLAQARNIRSADTEVSLDEEAANLVAFQRQYEANAELIRILNNLTETTINLIR